jgi:tyrosine phenol-lyase
MYFTTTRLHQELVKKYGSKKIPYVSIATNVNMAGGQPISMDNLKKLRAYTKKQGIRIIHDMTRVAENAYFIQQREKGYEKISIKKIVKEICSYTDGATMSAKKDALVNIGGFMATNEWDVFEEARNLVVVYEGLHTYGGLAGRDMEAIAVGINESLDDHHQHARVGQVEYLGQKLQSYGIPIVKPIGGHGIFVDAKAFLPHLTQDEFPEALAAEIFIDSGVRTMERGIVSAGRKANGENYYPKLELVRFTIPRRVYTQAHMDVVAESAAVVFERREKIKGLKLISTIRGSLAKILHFTDTPMSCM